MPFVYLFVSGLVLVALLRLPRNRDWLTHTIRDYYRQRDILAQYTNPETRQRVGYGAAYRYTKLIRTHCQPADHFLIPPQRYLIRNAYQAGAANGYVWLYPSIMYYHLGQSVHLLEMTASPAQLSRATHTFWEQHQQLVLLPLTNRNRPRVLAEFKKYDPHFFAYTPQQARAYYMTAP